MYVLSSISNEDDQFRKYWREGIVYYGKGLSLACPTILPLAGRKGWIHTHAKGIRAKWNTNNFLQIFESGSLNVFS